MPVTEESRHRLHRKLDETIGPEEATTLMEHLPPVGWSDVATKKDLAHLEERTGLRFDHLEKRFDSFEKRFDSFETRFDPLETKMTHQFWQFVALAATIAGLMLAAAKLF